MREIVATEDRDGLEQWLRHAREARANLPSRVTQPSQLAELRIPIPDRPGAAAEVFTLAAELGVNIASFEVVHSVEGNRGVAVVLVDAAAADLFRGGLLARGYRPAARAAAVTTRRIEPARPAPLHAVLADVPGSKSIANRALVCAALADGDQHPRRRGAAATTPTRCSTASARSASMSGWPRTASLPRWSAPEATSAPARSDSTSGWPARRRGSSPRSRRWRPGPRPIDGLPPLRSRPMADLHRAAAPSWAPASSTASGWVICPRPSRGGRLRGGTIAMPGDVTSQYITALMLIGPYLREGLRIELTTPLVSRPYLEITRRVMAAFGVDDGRSRRARRHGGPGPLPGAPTTGSRSMRRRRATRSPRPRSSAGQADRRRARQPTPSRATPPSSTCSPRWAASSSAPRPRPPFGVPVRCTGIEVDMADISDTVPTLAVVAPFADVRPPGSPASASSGARRAIASVTWSPSSAAAASARSRKPTAC